MKKIILISTLFLACMNCTGQTLLDTVKAELYKVNKVFDSSTYLGFDVHILYKSDTLLGRYEHEEMSGRYILNQNNYYYRMGNVEYSQNDSFAFNVYHDEKMLVMTRQTPAPAGSAFPLREFVDSTITWYDSLYTISHFTENDLRVIEFNGISSELPYKRFAIYYDSVSHYPQRMEMWMRESLNNLPDVPDSIQALIRVRPVTKKITMTFSNYYNPESLPEFENKTYVRYDRQRNRYQPNEKLKAYRFFSNGAGNDGFDKTVELYPPPPDEIEN